MSAERIPAGDLTDHDIREAISDLETDLAILQAALKIKTGRLATPIMQQAAEIVNARRSGR